MTASSLKSRFSLAGASNSRLGRRVLILFLAVSVLPLTFFTLWTHSNVKAQLEKEAERKTRERSKAKGMGLLERLLFAENDLKRLAQKSEEQGLTELVGRHGFAPSQLQHRFSAILITDEVGETLLAHPANSTKPEIDPASWHFFKKNGRALCRANDGSLVMVLKGNSSEGHSRISYGTLNEEFMLQTGALDAGEHLFVSDDKTHDVFCSEFAEFDRDKLSEAWTPGHSTGTFRWDDGDMRFLAGYWLLFSENRYGMNFMVVSSQSEESIMEPIKATISTLVRVMLLTIVMVSLLSISQIRRLLQPIIELTRGADRIADGDHSTMVDIRSGDELQRLGESFNLMSRAVRSDQRAKEEFFSMMSHELRTPLNAVLGFSQLLQTTELDDEQEDYAEEVVHAGEELNEMIQSILDFASTDKSDRVEDSRSFDLNERLASVARQVKSKVEFPGSIEIEIPDDCPDVLSGAPEILSQALYPLVDNAAKYCGDNPIVIRADAETVSGDYVDMVISVTDSGPGLEASDVERLRSPFERGLNGTKSQSRGAGLGIALSQKMIERIGGSLDIKSELGTGSRFSLHASFALPK